MRSRADTAARSCFPIRSRTSGSGTSGSPVRSPWPGPLTLAAGLPEHDLGTMACRAELDHESSLYRSPVYRQPGEFPDDHRWPKHPNVRHYGTRLSASTHGDQSDDDEGGRPVVTPRDA